MRNDPYTHTNIAVSIYTLTLTHIYSSISIIQPNKHIHRPVHLFFWPKSTKFTMDVCMYNAHTHIFIHTIWEILKYNNDSEHYIKILSCVECVIRLYMHNKLLVLLLPMMLLIFLVAATAAILLLISLLWFASESYSYMLMCVFALFHTYQCLYQ